MTDKRKRSPRWRPKIAPPADWPTVRDYERLRAERIAKEAKP